MNGTMTGAHSKERAGFGMACFVGAMFLFAIADTTAKWLGLAGYAATQIVFLRYVFGLLPVGTIVAIHGPQALRTRRPWLHGLRACLLYCALLSLFAGLRVLPLAEAIAVSFTAPLFVTALSRPLLGEYVGLRRWLAVFAGFLGALIMLRPGTAAFQTESLYVLASAFCFALAMILTRRMAATETPVAMLTYTTLGAGVASVPLAILSWQAPAGEHLWLFFIVGTFGGLGAYVLITAFRHAKASVLAPFEYSALIWATLFGWILWREEPGPMIWLGASVIVVSGLYNMRQEQGAQSRA